MSWWNRKRPSRPHRNAGAPERADVHEAAIPRSDRGWLLTYRSDPAPAATPSPSMSQARAATLKALGVDLAHITRNPEDQRVTVQLGLADDVAGEHQEAEALGIGADALNELMADGLVPNVTIMAVSAIYYYDDGRPDTLNSHIGS